MAMVAFAASCDDKNDSNYEPGAPTAEGCLGVYFNSSNANERIFQPGEATEIELTVSRLKAESAADVPLTVSADEGLNVASTASFAVCTSSLRIICTTSLEIRNISLDARRMYSLFCST